MGRSYAGRETSHALPVRGRDLNAPRPRSIEIPISVRTPVSGEAARNPTLRKSSELPGDRRNPRPGRIEIS
jgi:hypothetical protein